MRDTILIHANKVHLLSEITALQPKGIKYYSIQYYQAISKDDIYSITEDFNSFHFKLNGPINDEMDYSAYKDKMTNDEVEKFYQWCKLNKLNITNLADRVVEVQNV